MRPPRAETSDLVLIEERFYINETWFTLLCFSLLNAYPNNPEFLFGVISYPSIRLMTYISIKFLTKLPLLSTLSYKNINMQNRNTGNYIPPV